MPKFQLAQMLENPALKCSLSTLNSFRSPPRRGGRGTLGVV